MSFLGGLLGGVNKFLGSSVGGLVGSIVPGLLSSKARQIVMSNKLR